LNPVGLFEQRGETSPFVHAEITESGELVMLAQDIGDTPREWRGDDDDVLENHRLM
jgi:hypothetical protein